MGIWDYIYSTTDAVKRNMPDLTSVKDLCQTSYVYGNAFGANAVEMVKNSWPGEAFRSNNAVEKMKGLLPAAEKMKGLLPDAEARSRIHQFTAVFAKNAASYALEETLKPVPFGTAVYKIAKQSLIEAKKIDCKKELSKADPEIDIVDKNEANRSEGFLVEKRMEASYYDTNLHQKPEDVIRIFMMKGFFTGQHMFDDLMVPAARPKKEKSSCNP